MLMLSKILLKLSGEALKGEKVTIDPQKVKEIAKEIKEIKDLGVQIVIIIGAGNIWRGITGQTLGMKRDQSDYMGMLGTIVNALALQDALENLNVETRVMTSFQVLAVAEPYIKKRADHHLNKKRVIILSGGIGVPFFSTDTAAALRAAELSINIILMAKNNVKGVYNSDPKQNQKAIFLEKIEHKEIISKRLNVMDITAVSLCWENQIDIIVFDMNQKGNIKKVILEEKIGTLITSKEN
ncbi:MAG: UMP kinase [Pigeon pea little leaf phytoplasma]|uniref:Uridylate kinase n=1 Tax=Candidatus Phytoplasma fabacearum TaxID=2982628 RepID=A0ABU8ZRS6_9MOLU|nr:UMP kinase ['Bituminaria bituminosa' little leaf phytoplasma]MDV3148793.1 UMP kinase [Pigeon pea little leaf phytoplasma]MDO7983478.1 UMP kinase ['Bituminaria bituminosa' little leaf phytoplasma]MDO8023895.1 UMP kinase ['Bituminaria bituminosa' little leaf phytoplasma]MDO8030494.1 UMP kinase ['Bituminaria bituminosa' little leaf phytoplasma]MDV3154008.1 UMP kinase [Pigeon pea little leaf phytoplasma]